MDARPRGWWSRNWKWALPGGFLGVLLACGLSAGALALAVSGALQRSGAYEDAMARLQRSPAAATALGQPIDSGWWTRGRVEQGAHSAQAWMVVPVHGPGGSGTLRLFARRRPNGRWDFSRLLLEVAGRAQPIDLLAESDALDPSPPKRRTGAPHPGED